MSGKAVVRCLSQAVLSLPVTWAVVGRVCKNSKEGSSV